VLPSVDVRPSEEGWGDLAHVLDVRAMLGTAEATLRGAIAREESRGAHNRSDFPELDPAMEVNFIVRRNSDAQMSLESAPVPAVSVELASWLARAGNLDPRGKLLE
jgi:succinate dehydrogenase / fumarate reductase flavoprotein subunit